MRVCGGQDELANIKSGQAFCHKFAKFSQNPGTKDAQITGDQDRLVEHAISAARLDRQYVGRERALNRAGDPHGLETGQGRGSIRGNIGGGRPDPELRVRWRRLRVHGRNGLQQRSRRSHRQRTTEKVPPAQSVRTCQHLAQHH